MYLNNALLKTSAEYRLPTKFSIIFEYEPTVNLQPWTLVLGKITDYYSLSTYNGLFIHGDTTTTRLCASSSSSSFTLSNILQKDVKSKIAIIYDGTTSKLYKVGTLISSTSEYNIIIYNIALTQSQLKSVLGE